MWHKLSIRAQLLILLALLLSIVQISSLGLAYWFDIKERKSLALEQAETLGRALNHDLLKALLNPQADVFSDIAVHWLYDEVDTTDRGVVSHEILLSNGRVQNVKFVAFDMLTVSKDDFDISRPDRISAVVT